MKVSINLSEEIYPVVFIGTPTKYYDDIQLKDDKYVATDSCFNADIPNDLLKKWMKVFFEFEEIQNEINEYFGYDNSYGIDVCGFSSLDEIK